jgi:predicted ATP-dependent endonuclease of OLD family
VIITSLKLENFAGTKERTINFDEALTILKGANESGKTTVANAITYLLADKNLDGSSAKNIRPHDAAGKDVDHIVTAVE